MLRARAIAPAVAALSLVLGAATAPAAPTTVDVRIEGASSTLFEGPLLTDGHAVQAASDVRAHRCDGRNDGRNATTGPTPTAATSDALALAGQTFDGTWFPGYDDYFVERLGPDRQTSSAYWGVLVDGAFTPVGGCQQQLAGGDELLWAYDAFGGRPFLTLDAPGGTTVDPDTPLAVRVQQSSGGGESGGTPLLAPAAGVDVAPVTTAANGFETVHPEDSATVVTSAGGTAVLTFHDPGWHRVKATAPGFVRSNRLDVCVRPALAQDCGPPPFDAQVRVAPLPPPDPGPEPGPDPGPAVPPAAPAPSPPLSAGPPPPTALVRLRAPRIVATGAGAGLVGVRWAVLDAGVGIARWTIASQTAGSARWTVRASGATQTSAVLRLPAGRASRLRMTVVDALGRAASVAVGTALVPLDDRAAALHYRGRWSRIAGRGAWDGTLTRGRAGAQVDVTLAVGAPVLFVAGGATGARVELRADGRHQILRVPRGQRVLRLRGARRRHAGAVQLRVVEGSVALDGVAAQ